MKKLFPIPLKYIVTHKTEYIYADAVSICYNEGWLSPKNTPFQTCFRNEIKVEPQPYDFEQREDFFGNQVCSFSIHQPHNKLTVLSTSEVEILPGNYTTGLFEPITWEHAIDELQTLKPETLDARQYILNSPMITVTDEIRNYALPSFVPQRSLFDAAYDLIHRIYADFKFVPDYTTIATPLSVVLEQKKGVCQDFAHLAIACIRSMGLSARYISGYIETMPPKGKEKLVGADASHAWLSVYIPNMGWVDFDPTNNTIPSGQHITLAWGRDYSDLAPLKGVIFTSGKHKLMVSVDVRKV